MLKSNIFKAALLLNISICISMNVYSQLAPNDSVVNTNVDTIILKKGNVSSITVQSAIHPYKINYLVSGLVSVVGTIGDYFAIPHILNKKRISDEELGVLNSDILTGLDKWALP